MPPADARRWARLTHERNLRRLEGRRIAAPEHEKRKDVAIIEDAGTIVTPPRPENIGDLARAASLEFAPAADGGYRITNLDEPPQPQGREAVPLEITDPEGTAEIPLGFTFPFMGAVYDSVHVTGAGSITFGEPPDDPFSVTEPRDAARLMAGPPRIAPLYADMFPNGVTVDATEESVAITWALEFSEVQAVLRPNGSFRFAYSESTVQFEIGDATIGIAPGGGAGPLQRVDYAGGVPIDAGPGAIAQEFLFHPDPFDLAGRNVVFTPEAAGYAVTSEPVELDPQIGADLQLGNTQVREVELPFQLPFLGGAYTSLFVRDDGVVGLGTSCSGLEHRLVLLGPPCIAPLARNLRPDLGGAVHADVRPDRAVITWDAVADPGTASDVTFQLVVESTGRIAFAFPADMPPAGSGFVGVSQGNLAPPLHELDLSDALPATLAAGAIFESFSPRVDHLTLFDRRLDFSPDGGGLRVERGHGGFDDAHHRLGDRIALGCRVGQRAGACDSVAVDLPFEFPFLGARHDRIHVNSSGNLTLGAPDPDDVDATRMLGGPPRLTPFSFPGDPERSAQRGRVSAYADGDRAVITWERVFASDGTFESELTMQAILRPDGTFTFVHVLAPPVGVVGVAEGGDAGPITEIDFTADTPGSFPAGMLFEQFQFRIPFALVDPIELTNAYYAANPDKHDVLVVFTDFPVDLQFALAYHLAIKNTTSGLGRPLFDETQPFGSAGELEGLVMMNNINIYWPDPERMLDPPVETTGTTRRRIMGIGDGGPATGEGPWTIGLDSPISVLAHEVGHRWLSYVEFVDPSSGDFSDDLLGRDGIHWSFYFDTRVPDGQFDGEPRASAMEGNAIVDHGGPAFPAADALAPCTGGRTAFTTDPLQLVDGYSALDQYLMGVRTAASVPPFFYVDDPVAASRTRPLPRESDLPVSGVPFCGTRADVSLDDVLAHPFVGPREPAIGDEDDDGNGTDVKTLAFVLLTTSDDARQRGDAVKRIDMMRKTFERYANGAATGHRGRFDTRLDPPVH